MTTHNALLVLIIGPSGAGKDSVLLKTKELLAGNEHFVFPRRLVTRPFYPGAEDYIPTTQQKFAALNAQGKFILSWHTHGLDYGIPASIQDELKTGRVVIINVSREVVKKAREIFPGLVKVIKISASKEIIRDRLLKRGRESAAEIEERLNRDFSVACDLEIDNSGELETATAKLVAELTS